MKEDKGNLLVTAELPGVNYEDVKVYFTGDALVVEGERKYEKEEKREGYFSHRAELLDGSTARFQCREGANADKGDGGRS